MFGRCAPKRRSPPRARGPTSYVHSPRHGYPGRSILLCVTMSIRCVIGTCVVFTLFLATMISYWFVALPSESVESLQYLELSEVESLGIHDLLANLASYRCLLVAATTNWRTADQLQDSRRRDEFWELHTRIRSAARETSSQQSTKSDTTANPDTGLVVDNKESPCKNEWPWPRARRYRMVLRHWLISAAGSRCPL